jgi:hypothetical protein
MNQEVATSGERVNLRMAQTSYRDEYGIFKRQFYINSVVK